MKLTTIRMINSGNYSIANLKLDADSIQIAGRNNKGKTSLLWTLLFLFVVDRKKTTHKDYGSVESLNFYFRNPESSYIVFEGFAEEQGYFYMLLKRDGKNIKYYFVKQEFKEEFLIKENGQVRKFTEVIGNPHTGLGKPLKDVSEILAKVITSKKGELGFLRLQKNISSKRFGDLYKHLFEIGSTSNDILKDGILVSLGLTNEKIDFAKEIGREDISMWRGKFKEIANLKIANQKYEDIKEKKRIFEESKNKLKRFAVVDESINFEASIKNIGSEEIELEDKLSEFNIELEKQDTLVENIRKQKEEVNKNRGIQESGQERLQKKIERAESYGTRSWIEVALKSTENKKKKLDEILEKIKVIKSKDEVVKKLSKLKSRYRTVRQYLENNENLLLLNISNNKEEISLLNTLLSDKVKSLPKEAILKPLEYYDNKNILKLNNAEIDISGIETEEIPTKEENEFEKKELESEIELWENTLKAIEEKSNKKSELEALKNSIFDLNKQLEAIDTIPKWQEEVKQIKEKIEDYSLEYSNLVDKLKENELKTKELGESIKKLNGKLKSLETIKQETFDFSQLFSKIRKEISLNKKLTRILSTDELKKLYQDKYLLLENTLKEVQNSYDSYLTRIDLTRKDLKGMEDSFVEEDKFLEWLDDRCYRLEDQEEELNKMILVKKNLFSQAIKNFIKNLDDVRIYIKKTNQLISKYTISDLSKVQIKLIENEQQLRILDNNIDLFSVINGESIDSAFLEYVRKEKIIHLSDLFEIQLNREKAGKKESSKQSNGTEKMLRVMLLLILMRGMINPDDTIPFLIDEVADIDDKNQAELLSFFKQLNLLPISASPKASHEFEKVYHIEEIDGKSYLNDETYTRKVFNEQ